LARYSHAREEKEETWRTAKRKAVKRGGRKRVLVDRPFLKVEGNGGGVTCPLTEKGRGRQKG